MKIYRTVSVGVAAFLLGLISAHASIEQTWVYQDTPSRELIESWAKAPGVRNYLLEIFSPSQEDLTNLLKLTPFKRLQVEVSTYPTTDLIPLWKELASRGVQFIGLDLPLPDAEQVQLLNTIGFTKAIFLIGGLPDADVSAHLSDLKIPASITLAMSSFPRYDDKPLLLAIPAFIPITFSAPYWPWYSHMDLFNMLPHSQKLRVTGTFPSEEHLPYLNNLKKVTEVSVQSDFSPSDLGIWTKMTAPSLWWIAQGFVPEKDALAGFSRAPNAIKFTVDMDRELTSDEWSRLKELKIPVEWVRSAPLDQ